MSGSSYSEEMAAAESKTQKFNEVPAEDWVNVLLFAEGHDTASAALTNARFAMIVTNNRMHLPVRDFFYLSVECNWPLCRLKWVEHLPFVVQSTEWEENFIASNKLDALLPSSFVRHLVIHNFAPNERLLYIPSLERIGFLELNTLTSARLSELNTRVSPDGCFSWDAFPNLVECQQVQWTTLLREPSALPDFIEGCIRRNVRELTLDECATSKPFSLTIWPDPALSPPASRFSLDLLFRFLFHEAHSSDRMITVNALDVPTFLRRLAELHQTSALKCNISVSVLWTGATNVAALLEGAPGLEPIVSVQKTAPSVYTCPGDVQLQIVCQDGLVVKRGPTLQDTDFFRLL